MHASVEAIYCNVIYKHKISLHKPEAVMLIMALPDSGNGRRGNTADLLVGKPEEVNIGPIGCMSYVVRTSRGPDRSANLYA